MLSPTIITFFVIIGTFAAAIFFAILYFIYKSTTEWRSNNKAPKISLNVFVKAKNSESRVNSNNAMNEQGGYSSPTTTVTRTITFEESDTKRRFVFYVERVQFDLIFEGDSGVLTYQGTRFLEFKRDRS